ncbi:MAG: 3-hydroxyacyl-CoA dehydrogenase family protein [Chloroflexi bacterium]|nr:3-hydroxyacyl-CoA dehydrogenase family protein [Chloroflexota bacterium]
MTHSFEKIFVIGAGLMGHGIAVEFAVAGFDVSLVDRDNAQLELSSTRIDSALELLAQAGRVSPDQFNRVHDRLMLTTGLDAGASDADLVIEAVNEDLDLKQRLLARAAGAAKPDAVLTSNTSSFMPGLIADAVPGPERLAVTHYFNPPYVVPLVELVSGPVTDPAVIDSLEGLYRSIGKNPVRVAREITGFIANRLLAAMGREAMALVEAGIASPQDIDTVVKYTFGRRLAVSGPFEIWEQIGWDLVGTIAGELFKEISNDRQPSSLMRAKVAAGDLGVKTGRGFYDWTDDSADELRQRIGSALIALAKRDGTQ